MKKAIINIAALLVFCFFCPLSVTAENQKAVKAPAEKTVRPDYFPFIPGWQWKYNYNDEIFNQKGKDTAPAFRQPGHEDGSRVPVDKRSFKMTLDVVSVTENTDGIIAEVFGNYLDILSASESKMKYFYAIHKPTGYLRFGNEKMKENYLAEKFDQTLGDPIMILPMKIGQRFGPDPGLGRNDHMFEWYVEAEETVKVPAGTFKCLRLAFRLNTDHRCIWYCPKVGIVKMEAIHHGTVMHYLIELTEFGMKKK